MTPARRTAGPRPQSRTNPTLQRLIWHEIQRAGSRDWSTREIGDATGVTLSSVQQYVVALQRGRFVRLVTAVQRTQDGSIPARWVRRSSHVEPPIVTWKNRTARPQGVKTPATPR